MEVLLPEIIQKVLFNFEAKDLFVLGQTCTNINKKLQNIFKCKAFWVNVYEINNIPFDNYLIVEKQNFIFDYNLIKKVRGMDLDNQKEHTIQMYTKVKEFLKYLDIMKKLEVVIDERSHDNHIDFLIISGSKDYRIDSFSKSTKVLFPGLGPLTRQIGSAKANVLQIKEFLFYIMKYSFVDDFQIIR